jgi:PAS domain S-box-containing protein
LAALNHWKAFLDASPDALLIVDQDGRIQYTSTHAARIFGYEPEEMIDSPIELLLPEDLQGKHGQYRHTYLSQSATPAKRENWPLRARRKDGTEFPAHISLNPVEVANQVHIVASVRDITEMEAGRQELERGELRLRTLLDHIPDAVAVHRDGVIVYANAALVDYLGYDHDELIGLPIVELIHPGDHKLAMQRLQDMKQTGEKAPPIEERFVHRDGSAIAAEVHVQPMTFEGEPAFVVIGRDLTHKHELLARAMQLDRKLAVGTLATGVAHEINNPLSYAKASVEFVLQRLRTAARSTPPHLHADEFTEFIDALSDSSDGLERIAGIVDDLETIVDQHGGGLAPIDVEEMLEASLNLVYRQLHARAHVVRELRELPRVQANRGQLAEAFINVLTNALRSFDDEDPGENEVRITTSCVNDRVTITVSDNGCGMDESILACAFDPFFSTRDEGEGTGLGLTIARNTLERLGGGVEIDSVLGQGTTVRMWLPTTRPDGLSEMDEDTQPTSLTEDTSRDG